MRVFPERYDCCVVPWCLYRWTRYLQAFGNCSQGWTRLLEVYKKKFWGLGWFLMIFPCCQAKRHWVWRSALIYIHTDTSNWLKWCQLAYQKLLKPCHNFLEFSKLFKGTVNLVYVNFWPTGIVIQWIISEIICLYAIVGKMTCVMHEVDVLTDLPNYSLLTRNLWSSWEMIYNDSNQ